MNNRDRLRLQHILEWTDEILRMADKRKRDDLESDRMFCHAVPRCLEVVGEAASKISPDCRIQIFPNSMGEYYWNEEPADTCLF
ncbi:MAG: DUF86 domain-containing protein [bacterium]